MTYSFSDFQKLDEMDEESRSQPVTTGSEAPASQQVESPKSDEENERLTRQQIRERTADAKAEPKERGAISQAGDFIKYLMDSDGLTADSLNVLAAGLNKIVPEDAPAKPITQWIDDFALSSEETKKAKRKYAEYQAERAASGDMGGVEKALYTTANTLEGTAQGGKGGLLAPLTVAAKVTNQEAKWSNRPETLKDSPVGEAAFNISEVLLPTLLAGPALGVTGTAATGTTALVAESALETGLQGDQSELIASRTVAVEMGTIAEYLGLDGEQLTRDLLEDRKPNARVLNTTLSFIQNLGINFGANQVIKAASGAKRSATGAKVEPTEEAVQIGEILASSPESIQKNLDNVEMPAYRPDAEPTDVIDISTGTAAPTKTYVSEPAVVAEAMRKSGIAEDGLTAADRKFFSELESSK